MLVWAAFPIAFWRGDRTLAASHVQLLDEWSTGPSFGYWRAWRQCYEQTVALGDNDRSAAFQARLAAILKTAREPVFGDVLGTLREELAGPESLARAESGAAGWCGAELLRAHGERLLQQGDDASAAGPEKLFVRAMDLAGAQGALSWELRSATSLARVWHSQGRGDDARAVLTRVCDRFAEGFDTQDMRRAVTLLKSVGGNRGTTRRRVAVSGIGSC
jgi:hypothetical protein